MKSAREMEEAVARTNSLHYTFQASVFTRDMDTAFRACKRLNASAVMVNDHTAIRVDWMPFARLRDSGLGAVGIPHTLRDMQVEKILARFRLRPTSYDKALSFRHGVPETRSQRCEGRCGCIEVALHGSWIPAIHAGMTSLIHSDWS